MFNTHLSRQDQTNWRAPLTGLTIAMTLALTACSSSGSGEGAAANPQFPSADEDSGPNGLIVTGLDSTMTGATSPWLVHTYMFRINSLLETVGEGNVDLVRYEDDFPVSAHVEFYTPDLDTCVINDPEAVSTGGGGGDGGGSPPLISGGAEVVINTASGPWFTFNRSIDDGDSVYRAFEGMPAELLPAGATLSIPGDVFPAVEAHPMYSPTAPERLLPDAGAPLTIDSSYSWIPGTDKTFMQIDFLAYDVLGNFVDFAGYCDMIDDGSFAMPSDALEFIGNTGLIIEARYSRIYERVDFVDGIVFRQRSEVAE